LPAVGDPLLGEPVAGEFVLVVAGADTEPIVGVVDEGVVVVVVDDDRPEVAGVWRPVAAGYSRRSPGKG
jgi:hypothetical protein